MGARLEELQIICSEQCDQIFAAVITAQAEFKPIFKDSKNPFFNSSYAGLPAVVEQAQPVLSAHQIGVIQLPTVVDDKDGLLTLLVHPSGQYIGAVQRLHPVKSDPQAQGSAITYARRYGFMAALNLVASEDDDDGNAASRPAQKPQVAPAKKESPADLKRQELKTLAAEKGWTFAQVSDAYAKSVTTDAGKPGDFKTASAEEVEAFITSLEAGLVKI